MFLYLNWNYINLQIMVIIGKALVYRTFFWFFFCKCRLYFGCKYKFCCKKRSILASGSRRLNLRGSMLTWTRIIGLRYRYGTYQYRRKAPVGTVPVPTGRGWNLAAQFCCPKTCENMWMQILNCIRISFFYAKPHFFPSQNFTKWERYGTYRRYRI